MTEGGVKALLIEAFAGQAP